MALLLCLCWTAHPSPAGRVAHAEEAPEASAPSWIAFAAGAFFPLGEDGAGATGYAVIDEPAGPPFWTSYVRLGGADSLGPPLSRPFALPDARAYQLFERALLRWTPGDSSAEIADTLDLLWAAGREPWLRERGVPSMRADEAAPLTRIGWLTDDAIRDAYFTAVHLDAEPGLSAALAAYGLPASLTEERDGQIVQRFDKALLTRDLTSGVISAFPVGTLLRDSGLLTPGVLAPDRAIGGQLVTRAPRAVLSWPSVRGWGISEPVASRPPDPASNPPTSAVLAPTLAPSTPAVPTPTVASVPTVPPPASP
ncbi:MAG TPA: hypothetical protein VFN74_00085, partial [Chloroflexota bacterium]|nr:hypothetical protein [Chloroflexota bacterium]